jgi:probable DNA repair protein
LQSADECLFSWPAREDDRELRPSPLLAGIEHLAREDVPTALTSTWNQLQDGVPLERLLDEKAPPLSDAEVRTHGTGLLLWQSGCPFRAFAQARLAAEVPREASLGADFIDRGNVTELALQYVWEQLRGSQEMQEIPEERIEDEIAMAIDRAVNEAFPKGDEEWLRQHRDLERARLKKLIGEWLDVERKREDFHNVKHQQEVNVKIGDLTITGRADRIEQTNDGSFVVIDYKTGGGAYSPNWWDTPRPQDPQLPIYAVAQRMRGHEVAGVGFAVVRTGKCDFKGESVRKEIFGAPKNHKRYGEFAQTIEAWQPELERLAGNFLGGDAAVDPHYPPTSGKSTCRLCHLGALCRVAEIKATEDDDEPQEAVDDE